MNSKDLKTNKPGFWLMSSMGDQIYGEIFQRFSTLPLTAPQESVKISEYPDSSSSGNEHIEQNDESHKFSEAHKSHFSSAGLTNDQLESIGDYVRSKFDAKEHIDYDEIVNKLLESGSIQKILNNYSTYAQPVEIQSDSKLQHKLEQQQLIIDELTKELNKIKHDLVNLQTHEIDMDKLKVDIQRENIKKIDHLVFQLNRCCRKSINIESYIFKSLTSMVNNPDFLQKQEGFKDWLRSLFIAKTELEEKLSNLAKSLDEKLETLAENNNKVLMDQVIARLNLELSQKYEKTNVYQGGAQSDIAFTDQKIKDIVKDTLRIYDADKTGLVDYAMEPMGGQVITTRCTESYHTGTAVVSVLGLPLWYPTSSPRTVITPGINPGKCWAFQNYPGLLVIKLMAPITIEAFSLEHISKLLVPDGKIDSAPKDFEVYGLKHELDRNGVKIGQYVYDYDGEPLQFFIAQTPEQVFEYIELRISSNHGNPNYTCLYRFRVHGKKQLKS